MAETYKGKFTSLKNPHKYVGNIDNITYRSHWERCAFRWADENPNVAEWASEEIIIPYQHPIKGTRSRYYPDLFLKMSDGLMRLIEIKPKSQTIKPTEPSRKTKKYLNEVATWVINQEKWKEATEIAKRNNFTFEIWTEETLKEMGIDVSLSGKERAGKTNRSRPKHKPVKRSVSRPKRKS